MRRLIHAALLATGLAVLGGCHSGLVFHHVIEPLSTNFNDTPVGGDPKLGSDKRVTVQYVDVALGHQRHR